MSEGNKSEPTVRVELSYIEDLADMALYIQRGNSDEGREAMKRLRAKYGQTQEWQEGEWEPIGQLTTRLNRLAGRAEID